MLNCWFHLWKWNCQYYIHMKKITKCLYAGLFTFSQMPVCVVKGQWGWEYSSQGLFFFIGMLCYNISLLQQGNRFLPALLKVETNPELVELWSFSSKLTKNRGHYYGCQWRGWRTVDPYGSIPTWSILWYLKHVLIMQKIINMESRIY